MKKIIKIAKTRICETPWHKTTALEPFEKCPLCKSETYHLETKPRISKSFTFLCGKAEITIADNTEEALKKFLDDDASSLFLKTESKELIIEAYKKSQDVKL